jgi:hypothetical protein
LRSTMTSTNRPMMMRIAADDAFTILAYGRTERRPTGNRRQDL